MTQLATLPCPCCEDYAEPIPRLLSNSVRCLGCGLQTDTYDTMEQAVAAWNKRPRTRYNDYLIGTEDTDKEMEHHDKG